MAEFTDFLEMLQAVREHNKDTGHEIVQCFDPMTLTVGYACAECEDTGSGGHFWEILWHALRPQMDQLEIRAMLSSQASREVLLNTLNEHTNERFFGVNEWTQDSLPLLDGEVVWA